MRAQRGGSGGGSPTPARFARRPSPASRYRIYTSHDSESQTQEKPLIFGHFPHLATRKGQFGVSRCFDSSLAICVDTVAASRGRDKPLGNAATLKARAKRRAPQSAAQSRARVP